MDKKVETKEDFERARTHAHYLFDTLVLWIEAMQKEIYRLQGEARVARSRTWEPKDDHLIRQNKSSEE